MYSKRSRPQPDTYRYNVPREVRSRILYVLQQNCGGFGQPHTFESTLGEVGRKLQVAYGSLAASPYDAASMSDHPVIEHFFACRDDMALDFLEALFQTMGNAGGQRTVEAINDILQDSAVGYELTKFDQKIVETSGKTSLFGRTSPREIETTYPQIIKKDSTFLHVEATQPALGVLSEEQYKGANEEFLKAHDHYRHQRYQECLNECLKAFESTMKIICHEKGWAYQQADTASKLIKACLDNELIPTFSEQQLTSLRTLLESGVPTVRNKRGGHGQGVQTNDVPDHLAQYALHITAATVLLLAECAAL